MTNRTKNWLIAVSVAVTVGVASWGPMYFTRARIITEAQTWAEEVAYDIAEDLKTFEADASDRVLEEKLRGYLNHHSRIVGLDLYFYRDADTPSSRIVAAAPERRLRSQTSAKPASRPSTRSSSGWRQLSSQYASSG
jgi:hypothetical protein